MNTIVFHQELTIESAIGLINEINERKISLAPLNLYSNYDIYISGHGECVHARNLLIDYFSYNMGDTLVAFAELSGTLLEVFLRSMISGKRVLPDTKALLKLPDEASKDEKQSFMEWFRIINFPHTYDRKLKKGIPLDYLQLQTILKNHEEDLRVRIEGNEYV